MGYNLLINGVYWSYNPLTNHLLASWDIQVVELVLPHLSPLSGDHPDVRISGHPQKRPMTTEPGSESLEVNAGP